MIKKALKLVAVLLLIITGLVFFKIQFIGKDVDPAAFKDHILQTKPISEKINLTFLGTSSFIIGHAGKQLVMDPFFSNPNLASAAFSPIPYPSLAVHIDSNLYQNVKMVTVSHGHYDHCLDIGNFLQSKGQTTVVADPGIINELDPVLKKNNTIVYPVEKTGKKDWIYAADSSFRVFVLPSTHSPHIGHITFFSGTYAEPLKELPDKLWNWKLCACNSFMIDVLKQGTLSYRILMCTGNMDPEAIADLKKICKNRNTDLLLHIFWKRSQCWDNLNAMYLISKPNLVLLHHWNNFFRGNDKSLQYLKPSELPTVLDELNNNGIPAKILLPFSTVAL
jgi:Beta-lactamase superfamily domain